jgi:hypothetical protein
LIIAAGLLIAALFWDQESGVIPLVIDVLAMLCCKFGEPSELELY